MGSTSAIARDHVQPKIHGLAFHKVDGFDEGSVVIIRVPQSWNAPHMAATAGQSDFYTRTSSGKQALDVHEIRSALLAGEHVSEKIRGRRDGRLAKVVAGDLPVPSEKFAKGPLLAHVIPLSRDRSKTLDLHQMQVSNRFEPFMRAGGWNWRYNLDGLLAHNGVSYTLAFKNGGIEGFTDITTHSPPSDAKPRQLFPLWIESHVVRFVRMAVGHIRTSGFDAAIVVLLSLTGLRGVKLLTGDGWEHPADADNVVDRDVLVLPDVLLEGDTDVTDALRPMFDAMWQAGGLERSPGYDQHGKWRADVHRD